MTPGRFDIELPRNGSDVRILQLFSPDENDVDQPIDITGFSFSAKARDIFGGDVIATATVSIDTAADGKVSLAWIGSQFDAFGDVMALSSAAWDLRMLDGDGIPTVPLRGIIYITPEATA